MKNTKLFLVLTVCLLTLGCSSTIKRVQNNIQHKKNLENIVQRFAYKYEGQCRKEAYQYYPVAMVTTTQTKNKPTNYYKSPKTATCTSMGNQVTCRDTTIDLSPMVDAYGGYGKTTTSTYDANASGRNGYVNSCVQDALKQDDSFISAVRYEKNRHSNAQSFINEKPRKQYTQTYLGEDIDSDSKPWDLNLKQKTNSTTQKTVTLQLSDFNKTDGYLYCYYGEDNRPKLMSNVQECPRFQTFEL